MAKKNYLFDLLILFIIILLIINPSYYSASAMSGVVVWATVLVPTLFPFIFFSKVFSMTKLSKNISIFSEPMMKKLYNTSGVSASVFMLSILSGYPVGAKLTADYYNSGSYNLGQAKRICSYSSNTGPMFVIGTVGVGFLQSFKAGIIIYVCHIFGALINGLLYRKKYLCDNKKFEPIYKNDTKPTLGETALSSVFSILTIGVFVCIFFIIGDMILSLKITYPIEKLLESFGVEKALSQSLIVGVFEMTKGSLLLSATSMSIQIKTILSCFLISLGGLSTFLQAYAFLGPIGVKKRELIIQKITHSLISTGLCVIVTLFAF